MEEGTRRSQTRDSHFHPCPFRLQCPCCLLSDDSPRPSFVRHAELEHTRPGQARNLVIHLLRSLPQNFLQRKRHTVRLNLVTRPSPRAYIREFSLDGTSSCPPGTALTGLNYLKGQSSVIALPDEDYPPWLWKLLEPRNLVDDGPGGKAEKIRLRKENRQRIRDQNLLKTQ